jgi:hypothetical protein
MIATTAFREQQISLCLRLGMLLLEPGSGGLLLRDTFAGDRLLSLLQAFSQFRIIEILTGDDVEALFNNRARVPASFVVATDIWPRLWIQLRYLARRRGLLSHAPFVWPGQMRLPNRALRTVILTDRF